jgi:hypothetical protein
MRNGSAGVGTFDAGTWKWNFTDSFKSIDAIWGTATNDVWFIDGEGRFEHSDGGLIVTYPTPGVKAGHGLWGTASNDVWAGDVDGGLLHYDGGTWSLVDTPGPIHQIFGFAQNDFWLMGGSSAFEHFDGTKWTPYAVPVVTPLNGFHGTSSSNLWAVGQVGTLLHFDGGEWATVTGGGTRNGFASIWAASETDAWAIGLQTFMHFDGTAWTDAKPNVPFPNHYGGVTGSSGHDVWAFGMHQLSHYDGQAWSDRLLPDAGGLDFLWASPDGTAFGAYTTTVYRWTPATGWLPTLTLPTTPYSYSGQGLWGSGPDDVYSGDTNAIFHWNGSAWGAVPGTNAPACADVVWGSAPDNVWVYCGVSGVYQFNGSTWLHHTKLDSVYVLMGASSGPNDAWVVTEISGGPPSGWRWDGTQWTLFTVPLDWVSAAAAPSPHLLWVVGSSGQILRFAH